MDSETHLQSPAAQRDPDRARRFQEVVDPHLNTLYRTARRFDDAPPMVVAMDTGYFGLKLGHGILNGVFIGSLIPHISYGVFLGLLLERYLRHRGMLFDLIRGVWWTLPARPTMPGIET